MKIKQSKLRRVLSKIFRPRSRRHDPMLMLNMLTFNFMGGWDRTFSNSQYARSYA
jgi:hypothetical protein